MKLIIDVPSALVGAGALAVIALAIGAQTPSQKTAVQIPVPAVSLGPGSVSVVGIPDPRDILRIEEGSPYIVPAGQRLVVTSLGADSVLSTSRVDLLVDGIAVARMSPGVLGSSMFAVPPHIVAAPGAVVEPDGVSSLDGFGVAFGYLMDA